MRYQALLTTRQMEILMFCDETITTIPKLHHEFKCLNEDWDKRPVSMSSLYTSLCTLEWRGLVMRNPGYTWPIEWTATPEGQEALDLVENDCLTPSRRLRATT